MEKASKEIGDIKQPIGKYTREEYNNRNENAE
jgi:hypothetical protein